MSVIIQDNFGPTLPLVFRWTLPTANTFEEFELPANVKKISLRFETNDGAFAFDGTNAATHRGTSDADVWLELNLKLQGVNNTAVTSIFLAGTVDSTVVQVLLEG